MQLIKGTVEKLIKKYRTNNPFEIASQRNILVLFERLGDILGYFHTYKRIPMIHINSDLNEREQRFVCAHELGHSILHRHVNTPFLRKNTLFSIDRIEREANQFALELLIPDQVIYEFQNTNMTIYELVATYGVPQDLAHLKRKQTGKPYIFNTKTEHIFPLRR
ncbi:ImmA/IrrE family metallo-endopeptidase [Collibacillus ludicampi]|uniref:ImmA/IrrE family metallo-endopeptidase n=1 Tax=Collibacillus ludicampi TaxID=2771369 RepID=A0AAV4LAE1_9BACL|nr:ImmA/IrrE family metallo-endopeptidase [Collibacillus ludicampi]GIM44457.1 ImmA/IrrE family metallo-endopeptidase [Collibacillus ludicampi]